MYLCRFVRDNAIPKVIMDSLYNGGFALLIKGKAGTGKTLLALEILKSLKRGAKYYLTTRVSPTDLLRQIPWMKKFIPEEHILDARAARVPAETYFKKINTTNITAFIKEIYEIMQEGEMPVTLVIDSIDAIKTTMGLPWDNYQLEKALFEIASVIKANIIIVVERYDVIKLDYLVDGIVENIRQLEKGRVIRYSLIEKIRGHRITTPVVMFTLTNGKFGSFECIYSQDPMRSGLVTKGVEEKVKNLDNSNVVPTNIEVIDNLLGGGFRAGSFNIFEIHPYTGNTYLYFLIPLIKNMINNKKLVYFIPPAAVDPYVIKSILLEFINEEVFSKFIRIFKLKIPGQTIEEELEATTVTAKSMITTLEEIEGYVQETLMNIKGDKYVGITGADTLQYTFGEEGLYSVLGRWSSAARLTNRAEIVIVKKGQSILNDLVNIADTHFVLDVKRGYPIFYGNMPYTGYYGIDVKLEPPQENGKKAKINIELVPIE